MTVSISSKNTVQVFVGNNIIDNPLYMHLHASDTLHIHVHVYIIPIFKSQKGSLEALNFLIDYLRDYTIGFIIHYTMITYFITTEK